MSKTNKLLKDIIEIMRKPVMSILPGQMSFFLLLSLIPTILLTGVVTSSFSISIDNFIDFLKVSLPADTSKMIIPLLAGKGFDYNIVFLIVSALFLVSKGAKSIIVTASTIYNVESFEPIKDNIKSIFIAILLIILILFIIVIPVFGGKILNLILTMTNTKFITDRLIFIYNILKWPITIFIIFITLKLIYTIAPNKEIKSCSVNKGAIFTTILWAIVTWIYSFYVTHLAKYNIFYGSASNIIILMLWIYIISYIFVLGMGINARK